MTACSVPKDVVATIDGEAISKAEVNARLKGYREESAEEPPAPTTQQSRFASARAVLNQIINERLLLLEARRQGLISSRDNDSQNVQDAIRQVLRGLGKEVPFPSRQEALEFYEQHAQEFSSGTRYQLEHLLLSSEHAAWELKEELDKGLLSLTEAGRKELYGARLADSGKNRPLTAEELPPGLAKILPGLKPGRISAVIATPYGYHLIRIERTLPAGKTPFPEVENQIKDKLFAQRLQSNYQKWLQQSREQHSIKIFQQHLSEL
ncbi:MAG: peptidyl-prolyl cis-trans isomerase [Deltaproteobacteria bacterium]|nr:peptidyl-prolyl cis-trans isomerase [Deltaproteobacteria bacterium]